MRLATIVAAVVVVVVVLLPPGASAEMAGWPWISPPVQSPPAARSMPTVTPFPWLRLPAGRHPAQSIGNQAGTNFFTQWTRAFRNQGAIPRYPRPNTNPFNNGLGAPGLPGYGNPPSAGYMLPFSTNLATGAMTPMFQGAVGFMAPMMMNYAIASLNPTTMSNFMNLTMQPSAGFNPFMGYGATSGNAWPFSTTQNRGGALMFPFFRR